MDENQEKQEKPVKQKSGNGTKIIIIVLVVVVLAMAGVMAWILLRDDDRFSDEFFDPLAEVGFLPDMTESEIQAELNRVVEEGMLNISISGAVPVNGTRAKLNIQNTEANHYIIKVQLTLNDTGEVLYESGGIKPGQYIQYAELEKELEPGGQYEATAVFTAYTAEERQIAGTAAAEITLYVMNE